MLQRYRHSNRARRAQVETEMMDALEARMLLFAWTPSEVYLAELVNRARANPLAEGARLGIDLAAGLTAQELARLIPSEPLALNEHLTLAARAHSLDMAQRDFFDHVNPDGLDPTDRAQNQGYTGTAGENIAAGYIDVDEAHAAWLESLGHRRNVLSLHTSFDDEFHYDEFGPGIANTDIGPFYDYYTELFGVQASPIRRFLLGVVFNDLNNNDFYTIGEGMANVRIDVSPLTEPWTIIGTYTTDEAGNYQIPVTPGTYMVRFTNESNGEEKLVFVDVGNTNVKVDAQESEFGPPEDGTFRAVYGRGIQTYSGTGGRISAATVNQHGQPVVLQQGADGDGWTGYDLIELTGAPNVTGQFVSWTDPKDGLLYAAGAGASGVILFKQAASGQWSYRNLTSETSGVTAGNGQLVLLVGTDQIVRLAGLTAAGKLVLYSQTGEGTAGNYAWEYTDLTTHDLEAQGQVMPTLVGEIIGYVTGWNGLNVAGLDANGDIHAIWWAPGLDRWSTTNLSEITGAPPYTGGLTAYMTPWDGINLAGITEDGSLSVTWWVPSFGGEWRTNNLTAEVDGPILVASSVTSYVSSWGGLNVAGIDQAGRVVVYWWAPELTDVGWQVAPLSEVIPGAPKLEGRVMGLATSNGTLNVFGYAGKGNIIRYHWSVGGAWQWQDVTVEAGGPS